MELVIANKLYSSWSLRPWLIMHAFDLPFAETVIPLRRAETCNAIRAYSPAGKVPVLVDGDVRVWESLAIISYLAEKFPDKQIWPQDRIARAHALAISHEMHGGFQALRRACPMNLGKRFVPTVWPDDVLGDVSRVAELWQDSRERFGQNGPFLLGEFGAADAMFAPVVCRLDSYQFEVDSHTRRYMDAVLGHPSFLAWRRGALKEPWVIPDYEDGHEVEEVYGAEAVAS